jgi:hypothetical protein
LVTDVGPLTIVLAYSNGEAQSAHGVPVWPPMPCPRPELLSLKPFTSFSARGSLTIPPQERGDYLGRDLSPGRASVSLEVFQGLGPERIGRGDEGSIVIDAPASPPATKP